MVGDRARPYLLKHPRRDLDALANDALQQHCARADILRRQDEARVVGELSLKALAGEVDAIALDTGEDDFERGALLDRLDAEDRLWRGDRRRDRLGGEGEGDAEDVGVFDREELVFGVQLIGLPPQCAADDLLAQELRLERADPNDVGDSVRVPALRQHRD